MNHNIIYKNISKAFILICPFLCFISLPSCEFNDNPNEGKTLVKIINWDIDTTTFWGNKNVYVIKKTDFKVKKVLIIEAGTVVKFDPASGRSLNIVDSGYISCQGSASKPVIFTSLNDKSVGEPANDLAVRSPQAGDWDYIYIKNKIQCTIDFTNFYYGGGSANKSTLIIDSINADVLNCTFVNNKGGSIDQGLGVLNASRAHYLTKIEDCIFYKNELPLSIHSNITLKNENFFSNPKDSTQKNSFNSIAVHTSSSVTRNVSWEETEVPYVIIGNSLQIDQNASLFLNNDVVVKFIENSQLRLADGLKSIINLNGKGVILTSINDDKYKGDTRNDNNSKQPLAGEWSIKIESNKESFEKENVFYAIYE